MTKEEKQLLLIDLCARSPYGVICEFFNDTCTINGKLYYIGISNFVAGAVCVRPYLRPMSSMTEEEKKELNNYIFSEKGLRYFWFDNGIMYSGPDNQCFIGLGNDTIDKMVDWLNKNMFDYRRLIEKGLALEAPEGMYKEGEK